MGVDSATGVVGIWERQSYRGGRDMGVDRAIGVVGIWEWTGL